MIAPYMKMFKGEGLNLNTDLDLSIDIVNMDDSIKLAKGYFEFEGIVKTLTLASPLSVSPLSNSVVLISCPPSII